RRLERLGDFRHLAGGTGAERHAETDGHEIAAAARPNVRFRSFTSVAVGADRPHMPPRRNEGWMRLYPEPWYYGPDRHAANLPGERHADLTLYFCNRLSDFSLQTNPGFFLPR